MSEPVKKYDFTMKAIRSVKRMTDELVMETAINVTAQAKDLAPKDTGNLIGSIMWKTENASGGIGEKEPTDSREILSSVPRGGAIVGTACEYAVYQEYGTRKMFAQPFLRPAVDIVARGRDFNDAMRRALFDTVERDLPKK